MIHTHHKTKSILHGLGIGLTMWAMGWVIALFIIVISGEARFLATFGGAQLGPIAALGIAFMTTGFSLAISGTLLGLIAGTLPPKLPAWLLFGLLVGLIVALIVGRLEGWFGAFVGLGIGAIFGSMIGLLFEQDNTP